MVSRGPLCRLYHMSKADLTSKKSRRAPAAQADTGRALDLIRNSASLWLATCGRILTKEQELVQPDLNLYQLRILEAYEWCMAQGIPCRILALKPRQKGSSTVSAAIVYHHCRRFRSRAVQIADRYRNSDNLFAITSRYADHDDFPWENRWSGTATTLSVHQNGRLWSRIDKDTAENPRAGRSGTLQVIHVSEAAHFPNEGEKSADKTMLSLLNSLADVSRSVAIVETTANGSAGWFYEHWLGAKSFEEFIAGDRGNGWIRIFAPWFFFNDSRVPVSSQEAGGILSSLNERERVGQRLYGWSAEQIAWRRRVLAQKCGSREELFDQEYPEDEQSAFVTSGRPRFSRTAIARQRGQVRKPEIGFLRRENDAFSFDLHPSGWAQIWEMPSERHRYLLWCDTATGREQTQHSRDPDRHSILVLRSAYAFPDGESGPAALVARVAPPCFDDWHILEEKVIALSHFYGRCLIGVEVPMGLTLLEGLRRAGMPLFRRKATDGSGDKPGFQTNSATKPLIIASLSRALDGGEPPFEIADAHVIDELTHFVIHDDGREAALPGRHDDDVMALAMAVHHLPSATAYRAPRSARRTAPADLGKWRPLHRN